MKTTEKLIEELASTHTKTNRNLSPAIRTMLFLHGTFLIVSFILYIRSPFIMRVQNLAHAIELFSLFSFVSFSALLVFQSLVPGINKSRTLILSLISLVFLIVSLSYRFFSPQEFNIVRSYCEAEAIAISIVTTIIGNILIKRSEFAKNSIISKAIFIILPLVGTFFMHMTCSLEFMHFLTCHVVSPLIVPVIYLSVRTLRKN
jgi:hypothetical protein